MAGQVALVTGGSQRVGREIALTLARAGMNVAITWRSQTRAAHETIQAIEALGRKALAIRVNLSSPHAASKVHQAIVHRLGRLDVLVNNASSYEPTPLTRLTAADFDVAMAVNARAALLLSQKLAPLLAAHAQVHQPASLGRIVNLLDLHALRQHRPGFVAYNAAKAALWGITMSLARELAPRITVNAIAPGVVAWAPSYTAAQRRKYLERVPLARAGTPQDAARAVLFFVRDGYYCTGQVLAVDGGRHLT